MSSIGVLEKKWITPVLVIYTCADDAEIIRQQNPINNTDFFMI
jgi:hypothetical protein